MTSPLTILALFSIVIGIHVLPVFTESQFESIIPNNKHGKLRVIGEPNPIQEEPRKIQEKRRRLGSGVGSQKKRSGKVDSDAGKGRRIINIGRGVEKMP